MLSCHGRRCDCVVSPESLLFLSFFFFPPPLFYLNCSITSLPSLLADLSKHKRYEIRLSVYNAVGEGPSSAPQEVFVGEAGMCVCLLTFFISLWNKWSEFKN